MKIYYIGARLSKQDSIFLGSLDKQLHVTIVYSRTWFPYKPTLSYPIIVTGPFSVDYFNNITVLRFENELLRMRHEELLKAGASSDYPEYKPHISIPTSNINMIHASFFSLEEEYYRTWEEIEK